jgi:hypothetical protein
MEQDAWHLMWLAAATLGTLSLPIIIGLIAVLTEKP